MFRILRLRIGSDVLLEHKRYCGVDNGGDIGSTTIEVNDAVLGLSVSAFIGLNIDLHGSIW